MAARLHASVSLHEMGPGVGWGEECNFQKSLRFLGCASEKIYVKWSAQRLTNKNGEINISCCHEKRTHK